MYDKLVIKFKVIDTKILNTSVLVSKAQCNLDKKTLRRRLKCWHKMPNARGLKTDYNRKITEIENEILLFFG